MEAYAEALISEAEQQAPFCTEDIQTVYIGGGTPSLLPPKLLDHLIQRLRCVLPLQSSGEFTIEAIPGTLTEHWLQTALRQGMNRLSLGMQAAQSGLLTVLGRIHDYAAVVDSVSLARRCGVANLNLDLIFGIPTQTIADWDDTLRNVISLSPEHISAYGLIPEPGTPLTEQLNHGLIHLPDPEDERTMYDRAITILGGAGYQQYEISNFSKKGYECRHNMGYWTRIPYLGLGVSAASLLRRPDHAMLSEMFSAHPDSSEFRAVNPASLNEYLEMIQSRNWTLRACSVIPPEEARFETMMLGLRMTEGVQEETFIKQHHLSIEQAFGEHLSPSVQKGLLVRENSTWRLTRLGMDFQNQVLVELLPDE